MAEFNGNKSQSSFPVTIENPQSPSMAITSAPNGGEGQHHRSQWHEEPEEPESVGCQTARLFISLLLCPALGLAAIISFIASANVNSSKSISKVSPPAGSAEIASKAAAKRTLMERVSADLALFGIIYGALNLAVLGIVFGLTAWKGTLGYS